jgi:tripartite motif-containing protein 71
MGQFNGLYDVDVGPNGNVYAADAGNARIQYFTPTGSYLGEWDTPYGEFGVAAAPNGDVYTGGCSTYWFGYTYYTKSGSLLGTWDCKVWVAPAGHGDIAPDGNVYAVETNYQGYVFLIGNYTSEGSLIASWRVDAMGANGVGVSPNYVVYVGAPGVIYYYTSTGSLLGEWGSFGQGNGQFRGVPDVDVASDGRVFAADTGNYRVQYFTATGSFLGKWGTPGTGKGHFGEGIAIAVSPDGKRVYVADGENNRVQCFVDDTAVTPTSLGKLKAVFK